MTDQVLDLIDVLATRFRELTTRYRKGEITLEVWKSEFAKLLTVASIAAAMEGYGDSNLPPTIVQAVTQTVATQLGFLNRFDHQIVNASEFQEGWLSRAESYAKAIKIPYWKGKTKVLPLPAMPAQGTQCGSNCGCEWDIQPIRRFGEITGYKCYWVRGKEDSCQTCIERARRWNPLYIDIIDGIAMLRPTNTIKEFSGRSEEHV